MCVEEVTRDSLHFDLNVIFSVGSDLDRLAATEPLFEHRGICPLLVPAIFDCHQRVPARKNLLQCEGAVAIALITPKSEWIVLRLIRDQQDHDARCRLGIAQCHAVHSTETLADPYCKANLCAASDCQVVARYRSSDRLHFVGVEP